MTPNPHQPPSSSSIQLVIRIRVSRPYIFVMVIFYVSYSIPHVQAIGVVGKEVQLQVHGLICRVLDVVSSQEVALEHIRVDLGLNYVG